jgi:hypothetical protein
MYGRRTSSRRLSEEVCAAGERAIRGGSPTSPRWQSEYLGHWPLPRPWSKRSLAASQAALCHQHSRREIARLPSALALVFSARVVRPLACFHFTVTVTVAECTVAPDVAVRLTVDVVPWRLPPLQEANANMSKSRAKTPAKLGRRG